MTNKLMHPHTITRILAEDPKSISNYDSENGVCFEYSFLENEFKSPVELGQILTKKGTRDKYKVASYRLTDELIGWHWEIILVMEGSSVYRLIPECDKPTKLKTFVRSFSLE